MPCKQRLNKVAAALGEFNLPKNLIKPLSNFIESINAAQMNGSSLAELVAQGVVQYLLLALSFVILFAIFSISSSLEKSKTKEVSSLTIP